jgi:nitrogen fixation protein NifU and related proteins
MDLESLYQEIILDHYKQPGRARLREPFDAEVHHVNPTCGDEVTVRVHLEGGGTVDVSYDGQGCSISQASRASCTSCWSGTGGRRVLEHEAFLELMHGQAGPSPTRTCSGRRRLRRRREVPGARQVRAAGLDGLQGRRPRRRP